MTFFYWNKSFEIGVEAIDSQHRRLVELINTLAAGITERRRLPDVQSLFADLMDYAAVHFTNEERLLAACQLPEAEKDRHRLAHRAFIERAGEIMHRSDLLQAEVADQVLDFLIGWLISHILGSDKKLAKAMKPGGAEVPSSLFDVSPVERILLSALTDTERRFRLISDQTPALMWVADAKGERVFLNRPWAVHVGADVDRLDSVDWREFIHADDRVAYFAMLDGLIAKPKAAEIEYRLRRHDGEYVWFFEKILPRLDNGGVFLGLIASATDISAIKQAEAVLSSANQELEREVARRTAQIELMMLTDFLTGAGNRRLVTKRLAEEMTRSRRYGRSLSVIFIDLDHFKRINDGYGHSAGDTVLVSVAQCLHGCLRGSDLLGRFGGEEFVALLPETAIEDARQVAERMCADVASLKLAQITETVTVSAGVAEWIPGETGDALLARSDRALYRAKQEGRNCCRVDTGSWQQIARPAAAKKKQT